MRWFQVLLTAAWLLGGGLALADEPSDAPIEVLDLITEEEAAQPDAPPTRGPVVDLTDGPVIRVESPEDGATYGGPFPVRVEFLPGSNGLNPDFETLHVVYVKAMKINITGRVKKFLNDNAIEVPSANAPNGRHTLRLYIEDVGGNASTRQMTVRVEK
ncbi:MAG: hypothetical protein JRJ84_12730 [Deltaproteobacteria bacterium]|nr:hypothetical protein [Deltaproteobacteria bacterium]